jgi:mono/diheme cytochrome c family protein
MLRKILKWTTIAVGCIIAIAIIFYVVVYFKTEARINKVYSVKLQTLDIPNDADSYTRGKHIAENRGCIGCHGGNLAMGRAFMDQQSPLGVLYTANITSGKGGVNYTDQDWIRVLRHGLNRQNKSVWFMPSHEIYHISNEELSDLICFLKQQPAVNKTIPSHSIKPLGRLLTFFNQYPLLPAEMIDHNAVYQEKIEPAVTASYGGHLATTCQGCHGPDFKGAPSHAENEPAIPNITSTGHIGKWNDEQFINVFHTGKTPEGKQLSTVMPWREFTFTNDELKGIYLYLHQLK